MKPTTTVSDVLRKAHKEGMSQAAIGRKVGITGSAVNKYILGNVTPTLETIRKVANAFNIPESHFFGGQQLSNDDGALSSEIVEIIELLRQADDKTISMVKGMLLAANNSSPPLNRKRAVG